jgi:hypothetical protein
MTDENVELHAPTEFIACGVYPFTYRKGSEGLKFLSELKKKFYPQSKRFIQAVAPSLT